MTVGQERKARPGLALGVDLEQVLGHVLRRSRGPLPGAIPVGGPQAVQRRGFIAAAQELLDPVQVLDRNEQLVALGVLQLQVLALDVSLLVARVDQAHAVEPRDAMVDVHHQLARLELQRQRRLGAAPARRARKGPPHAAEELGVGVHEESQSGVGKAPAQVEVGRPQARGGLPVEVELDLGARSQHLGHARRLLAGQDHGGALGALAQRRGRVRPSDDGFDVGPPEVERALELIGVHLEHARGWWRHQALHGDHGRNESAWQLAVARLRGRQRERFLFELTGFSELAVRRQVEHHRVRREVVEQRGQGRAEVARVKLDPGEGGSGLEPREVVFPLGAHIAAEAIQSRARPQSRGRRGPASRTQDELPARAHGHAGDRHHRALVGGVVDAERLDLVAEELRPHRRPRRRREDVEDAAAQRELPRGFGQRLPRVAELDQPFGDGDRVGPQAGRKHHRGRRQVGRRDRRAHAGTPGGNDNIGVGAGERRQRLQAPHDRGIEGRRPVEEVDRHLGEER